MSLAGTAKADKVLRGKINGIDVIHIDTYAIAVKNGFEGTVEEWLASLKGEKGESGKDGADGYTPQRGVDYWTEADKAEMESYIDNKVSGAILEATVE